MSGHDAFSRLAPFIQEYIYRKQWDTLRGSGRSMPSAVRHASSSAYRVGYGVREDRGGIFPALTELYNRPSESVGILYIGPLKALINDQFERIGELLKEGEVPVWHWHGDVSQTEKPSSCSAPAAFCRLLLSR